MHTGFITHKKVTNKEGAQTNGFLDDLIRALLSRSCLSFKDLLPALLAGSSAIVLLTVLGKDTETAVG